MKTTLNRSDIFRFERLVSKLVKSTDLPQTVSFAPCSKGLQIVAFHKDAVLSLTVPLGIIASPFTLPWGAIKELALKKSDSVELDVESETVSISFNNGGVPQHRSYPSLGLADDRLPTKPDNIVTHPISTFDALTEAGRCVDSENTRYSLGSICLRGSKSQIISTDGRQALMQDGFTFPWEGDVLCPVSKIFGSKELREQSDTIQIGYENDWLYFDVGNVSFWLKPIEGKFPQLDSFTKNIDHFVWLNVDPGDADFVTQRLDNLPGKTDRESPVYVKLNDHVAVRGHDTLRQSATELRLTRSRYDGKSLTMPMNRRFLKNAFDLGMNRLGFDPNERTPVVGYGNRKTFVIMPLESNEPKVETDKLTVLASDVKISVLQKSDKPVAVVKPIPTTQACRNVKPRAKENVKTKRKAVILDDAVKLRQNLRDTLGSVNDLIRSIKSQRRQDKLLRDTVASLRKLQGV